jgi:hypothetical protein
MGKMNLNTSAPPLSGHMDIDEFMAFLETRPNEERWDLIEGIAVAMAPPSYAQQRIASNFQPQPDVVVTPGVSGYDLYSERFQLAAEVLSPTNARPEIDLKLCRYREVPDNLYAVVIAPREFWWRSIPGAATGNLRFWPSPTTQLKCRSSGGDVVSPISMSAPRSIRGVPGRRSLHHLIASGLVGEPTAPVIGSAGATNMNS